VDLRSITGPGSPRPLRAGHNVHSIAIQLPLAAVRRGGAAPVDRRDPGAVIGVWTSASRREVRVPAGDPAGDVYVGPYAQVSRLGNPLVKAVFIPAAEQHRWNTSPPAEDKRFAGFVEHPEAAALLPARHPGRFDRLAALNRTGRPRADLVAVLLTGIPGGVIDGFQNSTGDVPADMVRLNTAIPPAREPDRSGVLGGDPAGFPNGRRITDDVDSVLLRAIAGVTVPLVDPDYEADAAAATLGPGPGPAGAALLDRFPYLGPPYPGPAPV
jgi:hypothetical protein